MSNDTKPVVCATDLREGSDEAVRQADALARSIGAPLHVLHVLPNALRHHPLFPQLYPQETFDLAALEGRVCDTVSERVAALTGRNVDSFRAEVDTGTPYAVIVRRAEELNAEVLVVGGGQGAAPGTSRIGDTAEKAVRHAHCPVLVARPGPADGRVLVATDLSNSSLPAVVAGAEWARREGKRLTVLYVIGLQVSTLGYGLEIPPVFTDLSADATGEMTRWAEERIDAALRRLQADGERRVETGVPADVILRIAAELPAGLVAIGTAGLTGISRMLLGSVAEEVVRKAPCSVLVTRLRPDR